MTASTLFFNGRVTSIPGAYTRVDASGLAVVGLGASGIVAVIGEAEGGSPYNGATPVHRVSNPAKVSKLFREGDLREAGLMLFDPSRDPDIPGGAQSVKFVKVNPATQGELALSNADGVVIDITSRDYGLFVNQISLTVADGPNQGQSVTIAYQDTTEVIDDIGGSDIFSLLYTPGATGADAMTAALDNDSGLSAAFTLTQAGLSADYDGQISTIAGRATSQLAAITPGNAVEIASTSAADTTQTVTVFGVSAGVVAREIIALNGTTIVTGATVWTEVHGFILSAVTVGAVTVSDTAGPTAMYTITAGATSGSGSASHGFSGAIIEVGNGTITFVADAASTAKLVVVGKSAAGVNQLEIVTLNGVTPVTTAGSWSEVSYLVLGYVANARTLTMSGLLFDSGDIVRVRSDSVADTTQTITVYGLDVDGDVQTETIALNGTAWVSGTATWSKLLGAVLSAATVGVAVQVGDGDGQVVAFAWNGSTLLYAGFAPVDNVAVSGTLSVTSTGTSTKPILLVGVSAVGVAQVVKLTLNGGGAAQVTAESWSELTGICVGHVASTSAVVAAGTAFDLSLDAYTTVLALSKAVGSLSGWTFTVGGNAGPILVADADNQVSISVIGTAAEFYADNALVAAAITAKSQLVSGAVRAGATGKPSNVGPVFLAGGTEGTTDFADWQAALDTLREEFVNTLVVLTDDEAVHAAVATHCVYMGGPGRKERDAILGAASGETLAQLKARAVALNTRHVRLCHQDVVRFNTAGEREQFPPYFTACIAAGMQAGSSVGTPLTFKYLNILEAVGNDASYNLLDDAEELIESGLCAIQQVQGIGYRWLRNITTYRVDSNHAYNEASANEAVNYTTYNLRTQLERLVGKKGFAGTVNQAISIAVKVLGQLSNPADPVIVAWQNLSVELDGDVMTVDVEVAPVLPTNFIPTTIHLVSASISASA